MLSLKKKFANNFFFFIQNRPPIDGRIGKDTTEPEGQSSPRLQANTNQNLDDTIAMLNEQNRGKLSSRSADETDLDITQRDESLERRPVSLFVFPWLQRIKYINFNE